MEFKLTAARNRNLSVAIVILLIISILSLALCHRLYSDNRELTAALVNNKQIIVMPLGANKTFAFNGERGDARYLRLMALSLLNLRLNVSAENAAESHELLLAYACDDQKQKMMPALDAEKRLLKANEGSSAFYPTEFRVWADKGIVEVMGKLQFIYGLQKPTPVDKRYQLRIDTRNDGMCFNAFVEVPVEK
ncbi:TraE/TraK family type IV conjugative transfer system protein [Serratia marcescens]|uniref:TraE/TraK family type IV conjugative transfer system protein n=1 Tax=Serratia marcescens TaxID=615 RepID=UPI0032048CF4